MDHIDNDLIKVKLILTADRFDIINESKIYFDKCIEAIWNFDIDLYLQPHDGLVLKQFMNCFNP